MIAKGSPTVSALRWKNVILVLFLGKKIKSHAVPNLMPSKSWFFFPL